MAADILNDFNYVEWLSNSLDKCTSDDSRYLGSKFISNRKFDQSLNITSNENISNTR